MHMAKYNVFDTVFVTYLRSCQIHVYLRRISSRHGRQIRFVFSNWTFRQIQSNTFKYTLYLFRAQIHANTHNSKLYPFLPENDVSLTTSVFDVYLLFVCPRRKYTQIHTNTHMTEVHNANTHQIHTNTHIMEVHNVDGGP